MTLNGHYYQDYEAKLLAYFRSWRSEKRDVPWVKQLKTYSNEQVTGESEDTVRANIQQVLNGYNGLGVHGLKAIDLAKVLPPDPYETALKIMASVRAYFQG